MTANHNCLSHGGNNHHLTAATQSHGLCACDTAQTTNQPLTASIPLE